jgi:hypothetical protein
MMSRLHSHDVTVMMSRLHQASPSSPGLSWDTLAAGSAAAQAFGPGVESLSIKAVMKKLSRGMLRGSGMELRGSLGGSNSVAGRKSNAGKGSVSVKGRASHSSSPGGAGPGGKTGKYCIFIYNSI